MYYDHVFVTDNMAVVIVDCTLASEGRGMGFYVIEQSAIMFADRLDDVPRQVFLTEDEQVRLDEELNECEDAIQAWAERD